MPSAQEYLREIEKIIVDDLSDGEVILRLAWNDYQEEKAHIDRLRGMQRELRLHKKNCQPKYRA